MKGFSRRAAALMVWIALLAATIAAAAACNDSGQQDATETTAAPSESATAATAAPTTAAPTTTATTAKATAAETSAAPTTTAPQDGGEPSSPAEGGHTTSISRTGDTTAAAAPGGEGSTKPAPVFDPVSVYAKILATTKLPEMVEVPKNLVPDYYGIDEADYSAAVFYISADNLLADEVALVSAVDEDAAKRVAEKLTAHLEQQAEAARGYSPEQYEILQNCSVRTDGLAVVLFVSQDMSTMEKVFNDNH